MKKILFLIVTLVIFSFSVSIFATTYTNLNNNIFEDNIFKATITSIQIEDTYTKITINVYNKSSMSLPISWADDGSYIEDSSNNKAYFTSANGIGLGKLPKTKVTAKQSIQFTLTFEAFSSIPSSLSLYEGEVLDGNTGWVFENVGIN